MVKTIAVCAVAVLSGIFFYGPVSGQVGQDAVIRQELEQPPEPMDESEMQWVWGEVISVDPQTKTIVLKHLDYETDLEKEMTISVDEKTVFDNVASQDEIRPKDTLSIDYVISGDNINLARNISKEATEIVGETELNAGD